MRWLSQGPTDLVIKHDGFVINSRRFNTKARDDIRVTQNSGVSIVAKTMQFVSAHDKNPVYSDMKYYGVIQEIWELDYRTFRIPVFKCDWVESNHGVKEDELGFTLVNLNKLGHKDDPFILANQARQVFYIKDPLDSRWSVVLATEPRNKNNDEDEYVFDELQTFGKEVGDVVEFEGVEGTIGP